MVQSVLGIEPAASMNVISAERAKHSTKDYQIMIRSPLCTGFAVQFAVFFRTCMNELHKICLFLALLFSGFLHLCLELMGDILNDRARVRRVRLPSPPEKKQSLMI